MEGSKTSKRLTKAELEKVLLENFVNLQKVLTNLSIKFDTLSENISKLLQLFEISAKSFAEKQGANSLGQTEPGMNKEFLNKLDVLLEQNKTIAKGLTLIEGRLRESASGRRTETRRNARYPGYHNS